MQLSLPNVLLSPVHDRFVFTIKILFLNQKSKVHDALTNIDISSISRADIENNNLCFCGVATEGKMIQNNAFFLLHCQVNYEPA